MEDIEDNEDNVDQKNQENPRDQEEQARAINRLDKPSEPRAQAYLLRSSEQRNSIPIFNLFLSTSTMDINIYNMTTGLILY